MRNLIPQLFVVILTAVMVTTVTADTKKGKAETRKRKVNPAMVPVQDVEGLPRVLLIGDSISIGYTVAVQELLRGQANVHRPLTNCGPTTKGLEQLEEWLKTGGEGKPWDVIHFNWGLHDLKYMGPNGENLAEPGSPGSGQQVPMEDYLANLSKLHGILMATGAKLIWRTTTPVPEGAKGRVVGDSAKYNQMAAQLFAGTEVVTHDLYTFALERSEEIQLPANVHYSPEGSKVLAEDVVRVINEVLE
ncbi:MAG: SGNH/GDSL hydrolase family protein [Verrucomicrobiota bacterium]